MDLQWTLHVQVIIVHLSSCGFDSPESDAEHADFAFAPESESRHIESIHTQMDYTTNGTKDLTVGIIGRKVPAQSATVQWHDGRITVLPTIVKKGVNIFQHGDVEVVKYFASFPESTPSSEYVLHLSTADMEQTLITDDGLGGVRQRTVPDSAGRTSGYFTSHFWALLHHAGYVSFAHHDADGVATYSRVESGGRVWILFRPRSQKGGRAAYASSMMKLVSYPNNKEEVHSLWDAEVVYLGPGDFIIQPPGQVHGVYTPVEGFATGASFFNLASMHHSERARNYEKNRNFCPTSIKKNTFCSMDNEADLGLGDFYDCLDEPGHANEIPLHSCTTVPDRVENDIAHPLDADESLDSTGTSIEVKKEVIDTSIKRENTNQAVTALSIKRTQKALPERPLNKQDSSYQHRLVLLRIPLSDQFGHSHCRSCLDATNFEPESKPSLSLTDLGDSDPLAALRPSLNNIISGVSEPFCATSPEPTSSSHSIPPSGINDFEAYWSDLVKNPADYQYWKDKSAASSSPKPKID
ncbi:hypothetical protein BD769DRAFT_1674698 [Suillus cothurnatus]|nr:hypothetical protein BD769DRAFT_1674698 [Suillus cothurnatus]